MKTVKCSELGVLNCDYEASGETAKDVVSQIVDHLRSQHHIMMPDAGLIMAENVEESMLEKPDRAVTVIVERLNELLNIDAPDDQSPIDPLSIRQL